MAVVFRWSRSSVSTVTTDDRLSVASAEGLDLDLRLAGIGSRGGALSLDLVLQAVLMALVSLVGSLFAELGVAFAAIAGFLVVFGYPIVAEGFAGGRTFGKAIMGIRVVAHDGSPATFLDVVVRNLVRLIDALPGTYFVGLVAVLASPRAQRLGDMAAGTLVVHERRRREVSAVPMLTAEDLPPEAAGWDVSAVTAEEVAATRSFLARRHQMQPSNRADLAQGLAFQLLPKVAGVPLEGGPEVFLERVVAARTR